MTTERYTVMVEVQVPVDAETFNDATDKVLAAVINSGKLLTMHGRVIGVETYLGDFGQEVPDGHGTPSGD